MCLPVAVRYEACVTKVRGVALINVANRHLLAFRHLDLCYYTDKHMCLKTGTYGMYILSYIRILVLYNYLLYTGWCKCDGEGSHWSPGQY